MLLLHLLFLGRIRLLLREFRVFLLLLLLDSLPFLYLLRAELILLLLVLPVQLGIRGGLNDGPWRSRNLVRMDGHGRSRPIGLCWLSGIVWVRWSVRLRRLRRNLAFLPLLLQQPFLLFRVLLLQLLRLLLMSLLHLLFLGRIRLLLREFRVFLLLLLLDSLPILRLLRAELILLLLVLPVQPGVRGGLNDGPWRNRNLARMDDRGMRRPIRLCRLSGVVRVHRTCGRPISRTVWSLDSHVTGIRRHLPGWPILGLNGSVRL
jgi:hypothetical protein